MDQAFRQNDFHITGVLSLYLNESSQLLCKNGHYYNGNIFTCTNRETDGQTDRQTIINRGVKILIKMMCRHAKKSRNFKKFNGSQVATIWCPLWRAEPNILQFSQGVSNNGNIFTRLNRDILRVSTERQMDKQTDRQ